MQMRWQQQKKVRAALATCHGLPWPLTRRGIAVVSHGQPSCQIKILPTSVYPPGKMSVWMPLELLSWLSFLRQCLSSAAVTPGASTNHGRARLPPCWPRAPQWCSLLCSGTKQSLPSIPATCLHPQEIQRESTFPRPPPTDEKIPPCPLTMTARTCLSR